MGDVKNMKILHKKIVEFALITEIQKLQNIVMYLHALAIHDQYDDISNTWVPLLKTMLC